MSRPRPCYRDRTHAGEVLGAMLVNSRSARQADSNAGIEPEADTQLAVDLVLAIPNGGVPVAIPIAAAFRCELELMIVRKLKIPYNPEAGFGAVTADGGVILNAPLVQRLGLDDAVIDREVDRVRGQLEDRMRWYRGDRPYPALGGKRLLIVDDGLASGFSMLAAVRSVRCAQPTSIIVAVPTAPRNSIERVEMVADKVVCPAVEEGPVFAVANAYENWYDLDRNEVVQRLRLTPWFGPGEDE